MREHLNTALYGLRRSAIREFSALAAATPGCVSLTLGEPDFDTPAPVREAACAALGGWAKSVTAERIAALNAAARQTGSTLSDPFATLSFLALPVIPALKLTDQGLFACP